MPTRTIPCRVCGKSFVPCNKTSSALGAFNYHAVACSPECGAEYLRRVQTARQQSTEHAPLDANASMAEEEVVAGNTEPKRTRGKRRETGIIEDTTNTEN